MSVLLAGALLGTGGGAPRHCAEERIPVSVREGGGVAGTVAATWCTPNNWSAGPHRTDVLVAGATYNRDYWDWPQHDYSYVHRTLRSGRATLNFDRLGTGRSSAPAGPPTDVVADAWVLHQVIGWVRHQRPTEVNVIGHSLGSIVVTKEAARWRDADRVVITGILHLPGVGTNSAGFATSLYPAGLDPRFAGVDRTGYLTTLPGRRGPTFYDPRSADPEVIQRDEEHKDLATVGELAQSVVELETPALLNTTRRITAPVLLVMGATDNIFCNLAVDCRSAESVRTNEAPYYAGAARLDAVTVPDTAHNLTLHPSADRSFRAIDDWLR
ncbi:alpha/beta fold hydrolase [Pseudonocardia eucalypti]|uniref:Alpha/beta fold hydrolase n=1 Tax=Pseudonocardia eucalypti TaxID=648755 RepID=A0ABP9QCP6_9PSEU